jgi:phospholipase/carboxylesterase
LESYDYIKSIIDNESKIVPSNSILLCGFGQGAALALFTGLQYPKHLKKILCINGYPIMQEFILDNYSEESKKISILAIHGKENKKIPLDYSKQFYEVLYNKDFSINTHYEDYQGHTISSYQRDYISMFFGNIFTAYV